VTSYFRHRNVFIYNIRLDILLTDAVTYLLTRNIQADLPVFSS